TYSIPWLSVRTRNPYASQTPRHPLSGHLATRSTRTIRKSSARSMTTDAQLQQQQHQGSLAIMSRDVFHAEWLKHSRSVLDNIRADWSKRPQGSWAGVLATTMAIKSTANNTSYRPVANVALQQTMAQPMAPPEQGWRKGETLHPYYELMLRRFEAQLGRLLEAGFGGTVMLEGGRTLQAEALEL
ncbi:hypothetical protein ACJ73_10273, partial [Blastomyces percursus]